MRKSALGRIRTCDTGFRRAVLYPLSYEGGGPDGIVDENLLCSRLGCSIG